MKPLSVLELYSGIGGMHWALKESHPSAEVVAAYDINPVANTVYKYNFPEANVSEKAIDGLRYIFLLLLLKNCDCSIKSLIILYIIKLRSR